jgi:hypothetical protein
MNVVRKEDKEAYLKEFIQKDISQQTGAAGLAPLRYHLVTLSLASPVAQALAGLANELIQAGITLHIVLARIDGLASSETIESLDRVAVIRHVTDPRLLDAHEQLVMGSGTLWIGDCMRRDPAKRDAYECYGEGCTEDVAWALRAFEKLWAAAQPIAHVPPARTLTQSFVPDLVDPAIAITGANGPISAATRH